MPPPLRVAERHLSSGARVRVRLLVPRRLREGLVEPRLLSSPVMLRVRRDWPREEGTIEGLLRQACGEPPVRVPRLRG